jgi:hypothetical protein
MRRSTDGRWVENTSRRPESGAEMINPGRCDLSTMAATTPDTTVGIAWLLAPCRSSGQRADVHAERHREDGIPAGHDRERCSWVGPASHDSRHSPRQVICRTTPRESKRAQHRSHRVEPSRAATFRELLGRVGSDNQEEQSGGR